MFFVYILYSEIRKRLYSEIRQRYYVGQTNEINQRLERHNHGKVRSTKSGVPWQLIKTFEVNDRAEAMRLEAKIKGRGIKRFLKEIEQN